MKLPLKIAGQMLSYYVLLLVLSILILTSMADQALWIHGGVAVLLWISYTWMMYNDGAARGERATTLTASIVKQREEGRPVGNDELENQYNPAVAWKGYALGIAPLIIIAALNIIMEPHYPPFQPFTEADRLALEEQAALMEQSMPELAMEDGEVEVAEPDTDVPMTMPNGDPIIINPYNVTARAAFMPYQVLYRIFENNAILLNWLLLLIPPIMPLAMPIGYLQGPRLRELKLKMIAAGTKRKRRNLKVNKKKNQPKGPKMEV